MVSRLKKAFAGVVSRIGDPLLSETLIGPLHTPAAVEAYKKTVAEIVKQGGTIEFGGKVCKRINYRIIITIHYQTYIQVPTPCPSNIVWMLAACIQREPAAVYRSSDHRAGCALPTTSSY